MKKLLENLIGWTIAGIGLSAGNWLWSNVLEERANKAKDHFTNDVPEQEERLY